MQSPTQAERRAMLAEASAIAAKVRYYTIAGAPGVFATRAAAEHFCDQLNAVADRARLGVCYWPIAHRDD